MELSVVMGKNNKCAWVEEPISTKTSVTCFLFLLPNNKGYNFFISKRNVGCYISDSSKVDEEQKEEYHEKYYDFLINYLENE